MAFEDLGKKLQQLGQDTVSSVQKMSEAVQANSKLSEAKRDLTKAYAALGEAVAAKYGEAPEGLEEQFAAIDAAKEAIAACEKIVSQIKGVTICPECGKEAGKGEKFCSSCGAKLPHVDEEEDIPAAAPQEETEEQTFESLVDEAEAADETADADAAQEAETADETAEAEAAQKPETEKPARDIDTDKLVEEMKQAGQAAGDVINEAADKARVLLGNFTGKAGTFMSGLSSKLSEKAVKTETAEPEAEDITAAAADDSTPETDSTDAAAEAAAAAAEEARQSAEALAEKIQNAALDTDEEPQSAEQDSAGAGAEEKAAEDTVKSYDIPIE